MSSTIFIAKRDMNLQAVFCTIGLQETCTIGLQETCTKKSKHSERETEKIKGGQNAASSAEHWFGVLANRPILDQPRYCMYKVWKPKVMAI
jgi:hypothetical protein